MTRDEMLIGWLCIYRLQHNEDGLPVDFMTPPGIADELIAKGWTDQDDNITDLGVVVSDLNAADWGIDAVNHRGEAVDP